MVVKRAWKHTKAHREAPDRASLTSMGSDDITWLSTAQAARRLGVTSRTLYRFINEGQLPAYKFGRVIRLQQEHIDAFIEASRIAPGTLEHLYPEVRATSSDTDGTGM